MSEITEVEDTADVKVDFAFKEGARVPEGADPAQVGAVLERLRKQNNDDLTAAAVLKEASKRTSPLHDWFDWSDSEAAKKWRLHQARRLISTVVYVYRTDPEKEQQFVRAYVSVRKEKSRTYRSILDVQENEDDRRAVLTEAYRELMVFKRKYRQIAEFFSLFAEIDSTLEKVFSTPSHIPSVKGASPAQIQQ